MKQKNPAPAEAGRGAEHQTAGASCLVPPLENFNQRNGARLLREIVSPECWCSAIPEDRAADLRLARQVERAFKNGPAPFFYMLRQCGRDYGVMTRIEAVVDAFANLDPDVVRAMGGDKFVEHLAGLDGGKK